MSQEEDDVKRLEDLKVRVIEVLNRIMSLTMSMSSDSTEYDLAYVKDRLAVCHHKQCYLDSELNKLVMTSFKVDEMKREWGLYGRSKNKSSSDLTERQQMCLELEDILKEGRERGASIMQSLRGQASTLKLWLRTFEPSKF